MELPEVVQKFMKMRIDAFINKNNRKPSVILVNLETYQRVVEDCYALGIMDLPNFHAIRSEFSGTVSGIPIKRCQDITNSTGIELY